MKSDPRIAYESLYNQLKMMIVQPLKESAVSTVIIIDALDECKDEEPASAILSVIGRLISELPKIKFFVTGRPEPRIRASFHLPLLEKATDVFVLHDIEPHLVNNDIRLFLRHKFTELAARRHGLDGWPTMEQLDLLCERAAGLFVYAEATVRFVDHKNSSPKEQLDRLLQSAESSVLEGKTEFKANATLDSLYTSILQEAFGDDDPEDDFKVRSVLGAVIVAVNPLSPSSIATLLGFDTEEVFPLLLPIHSLLTLQDNVDQPVRSFHRSFPDFIVDPARCTNPRFHIPLPDHQTELLVGCLDLTNRKLEQNMCELPDGVINSEVDDLKERTEKNIDHALEYACQSWHKHLDTTLPARTSEITSTLHRFLEGKFLFWLEVLSVLGAARRAVDALDAAAKWLNVRSVSTFDLFSTVYSGWIQASPTLDLINDYLRFVIGFFEVISASTSHIYHSALPLSPKNSTVRKLYEPYARPSVRVVCGIPTSWEPAVATVRHHGEIRQAAWSPCSRYIAVSCRSPTIEILDAVTLGRLHTFKPQGHEGWLSFSPDSRLLTQFGNDHEVTTWDLQTGGRICTIPPTSDIPSLCFSSTYSTDGKVVAVAYKDEKTEGTGISTYNLLSGTRTYSHIVTEGRVVASIWTHDEFLRFVTVKPGTITMWQVGFASIHTLAMVESFPTPDNINYSEDALFLPTRSRFTSPNLGIWDVQGSKLLLEIPINGPTSFSSDGRFFVYKELYAGIQLWEESPAGYILRGKLGSGINIRRYSRPLLSPNGKSIVTSTYYETQLWRIADPIASLSSAPTSGSHFLLDFSSDGSVAAAARAWNEMVTVIDLKSGNPRLIIDTEMEIWRLWVTGNTVTVFDWGKVVAWELPAGEHVLNTRATINNSVRTIKLDHLAPPSLPSHITEISCDLNYIVALWEVGDTVPSDHRLDIYDTTGNHLIHTIAHAVDELWITPDGCEVGFSATGGRVGGWKIIKDGNSNVIGLEPLPENMRPPGGYPRRSSHGYDIADDGWILNSRKKRVMWLPHYWRKPNEWDRMWDGRFLGLIHDELQEPVIVELGE